jgi:hypothetical protein
LLRFITITLELCAPYTLCSFLFPEMAYTPSIRNKYLRHDCHRMEMGIFEWMHCSGRERGLGELEYQGVKMCVL